MPLNLTVVILTKNEAIHIVRALKNLAGLAQRVVVVDSYSTDETAALARSQGAEVFQNKFINYARQFQWALDNTSIESSWVMRLDADELIETDLRVELLTELPELPVSVVGINLKRKHIFMGRWVRHGGRYPLVLLRIWRTGHGRIENRWMDEHMVVTGGRIVTMRGGFSDWNLNDLSFFTDKHNLYATREAIDVLGARYNIFDTEHALAINSTSMQASVKRFLKNNFYNRLPYSLSASLYILWRYIFQFGFLDGQTGMIYHVLQGFWYRFLVGAKVHEFDIQIRQLSSREARINRLQELTGYVFPDTNDVGVAPVMLTSLPNSKSPL